MNWDQLQIAISNLRHEGATVEEIRQHVEDFLELFA